MPDAVVRRLVLGIALVAVLLSLAGSVSIRRVVNVELMATWASTPLLLEASEFCAEEGNEYFWNFINAITADKPAETEEAQLNQTLKVASELLSPVSFSLLKFSLHLRYYSARVEMFRQYAAQLPQFTRVERGWAQVGADHFSTVESLRKHLLGNPERQSLEEVLVFGVDEHVYPTSAKPGSPIVVLYAHLGTEEFASFHGFLSEEAKKENIIYILRHCPRYSVEQARIPLTVQGYGVELAIKSMEYKAIDDSRVSGEGTKDFQAPLESQQEQEVEGFLFSKLVQRKPQLASELESFKDHLMLNMQENEGFDQLKAWQVKDLGYQAAQRIVLAAEPLVQLQDLAQNFPLIASSLSRLRINETIKATLERNSELFQGAGLNFLYMNGQILDASTDAFTLFARIRQEIKKSDSLRRFGISPSEASRVMSLVISKKPVVIDIREPDPEDNQLVQFINDVETDPAFGHWSSNIYSLLQPSIPGQFRFVRKNIFTCVLAIDPSRQPDLVALDTISSMLDRGLPIRLGIILLTGTPASGSSRISYTIKELEAIASGNFETADAKYLEIDDSERAEDPAVSVFKAFCHIKKLTGIKSAYSFLSKLLRASVEKGEPGVVGSDTLYDTLAKHLRAKRHSITRESWDEIRQNEYNKVLRRTQEFVAAKRLFPQKGSISFFVNGELTPLTYENQYFQINMQIRKMVFYGYAPIVEGLQSGEVTSETNIYDYLLSKPGTYPRYNPVIFGEPETFVSLVEHAAVLGNLKYFSNLDGEFEVKLYSHVLVLDLSSIEGVQDALLALLRLVQESKDTAKVRISYVHNSVEPPPPVSSDDQHFSLTYALMAAAHLPPKQALPFAIRLLSTALRSALEKGLETVSLSLSEASAILEDTSLRQSATAFSTHYESYVKSLSPDILQRQRRFAIEILKLTPGQRALVTNGRVIRLGEHDVFTSADYSLLEEYERVNHIQDVYDVLKDIQHEGIDPDDLTSEFFSNELAVVVSLLGEDGAKGIRKMTFPSEVSPTFITSPMGSDSGTSLTITAVLDPLSKSTQSITPLLLNLVETLGVTVRVVLNPKSDLSDIPLKNFYRFVLQSHFQFDSAGLLLSAPESGATFTNLPTKQLLTLNMDTPRTWLVQPVAAVYDLDNIRLGEMGDDHLLSARFKLEHILTEGNCADVSNGNSPPTGLQLNIGTSSIPHMQDTVVMSNLGYFQLQTNPGIWQLSISPGRHSRIYSILSSRTPHSHVGSVPVVVRDFVPSFHDIQVERNAGMESEVLLVPGEEDEHAEPTRTAPASLHSMWDSLTSFWGESKLEPVQPSKQIHQEKQLETINVFSVASGHLYERFLKIMMLSVVKHTSSPVKFWFVNNFLSPKFKQLLPALSKELNCSVELVTYKWPSWLHQETEKQRVIWGYKILFLDVLFPLHVKKIVYVDADQVVRADLKELIDLDLQGAPYGYTPFCSSRTEMDGYRFWKDGYWKSHLGDKPYHISALYVVDLVRFRSMGAGDQLRSVYHQFSNDQNSLSNLDQDLPNYLQHSVPIFSLPQHWLWCETWCDDTSKAAAKTIDLCNNPLTKTPKLENAMRIVPEWVELDNTIKAIEKKFYSGVQDATSSEQTSATTNAADQSLETMKKDILI